VNGTTARCTIENIFRDIPGNLGQELLNDLLVTGSFRVERIVSRGHASPEGFWYDQGEGEWVLLLQGAAGLRFEGEPEPVVLYPGDHLHIKPHIKHRVDWTARDQDTIWLAIYYNIPQPAEG
jgi:cupin 2 domain-containing protein